MSIREKEMMHGAVLHKLCRNDTPVTLRLIETQDDMRSVYWINDVVLYMKHSTTPRLLKRSEREHWRFSFDSDHVEDIASLMQNADVYLVLICAQPDMVGTMEVCILDSEEIQECLDLFSSEAQWIAVEAEKSKCLKAYGPCNGEDKITVSRSRLDKWEIPGS